MKNKILRILFLVLPSVLIISCTSSESILRSEKQIKDLESQVISVQQEVAFLKGKIESMENSLASINNQVGLLQSSQKTGTSDNTSTEQNLREPKTSTNSQPSVKNNSNTNSKTKTIINNKSSSQVGSGRCQAITKKGTQCKRSAKPGSIYCWQHGG